MSPSAAGRRDGCSGMAVIARFGKNVLCRESNEESPESQWLFGAVWGAQPQRSPRGKHGKTKRFTQKRTHAVPPTPFSASPRTPSGSTQRNAQSRSELNKSDNRTTFENVLMAIPTHGGIETQDTASRLSFPDKGKETGVNRTQNAPISLPTPSPRAYPRLCRSYNRPDATFRRRTIHDRMKRKYPFFATARNNAINGGRPPQPSARPKHPAPAFRSAAASFKSSRIKESPAQNARGI